MSSRGSQLGLGHRTSAFWVGCGLRRSVWFSFSAGANMRGVPFDPNFPNSSQVTAADPGRLVMGCLGNGCPPERIGPAAMRCFADR
jgi:hypothetical protein